MSVNPNYLEGSLKHTLLDPPFQFSRSVVGTEIMDL